jgi:hypothetical protein
MHDDGQLAAQIVPRVQLLERAHEDLVRPVYSPRM